MERKILLSSSDDRIRRLLEPYLKKIGYSFKTAQAYSEAFTRLASYSPDVVIIDISSDTASGLKAIENMREFMTLPIIAITGPDSRLVCRALDSGADISLQKPLSPEQLISYIRVCIKRTEQFEGLSGLNIKEEFIFGKLRVDFGGCRVFTEKGEIHLTKNEFRILSLLCRYSGRVLPYDFIMKNVWGPLVESGNGILRVNIANIRKKIEKNPQKPEYLITENGVGYRVG